MEFIFKFSPFFLVYNFFFSCLKRVHTFVICVCCSSHFKYVNFTLPGANNKPTVYIHLLMPKLDTSSVMFLESLDVLGLSTSYALLQVTQPGLIRPQLVSRWLASYHDSPLLSHSHLEALSAALVVLRMALLFLSPSMPKLLKALAKERAANPLQPTSTGKHLALEPAC